MPKIKSNKAPKLKKAPTRSQEIEEAARKNVQNQRALREAFYARNPAIKRPKALKPNPILKKKIEESL